MKSLRWIGLQPQVADISSGVVERIFCKLAWPLSGQLAPAPCSAASLGSHCLQAAFFTWRARLAADTAADADGTGLAIVTFVTHLKALE